MCQVNPVRYSEILELDRRIRDFNVKAVPDELVDDSGALFWQSHMKIYRESGSWVLHIAIATLSVNA